MTREEILQRFNERVLSQPLPDLSEESQYVSFCESLSERTRVAMEEMDRLQSNSIARAHSKMFG